jgi:hypothetical protein
MHHCSRDMSRVLAALLFVPAMVAAEPVPAHDVPATPGEQPHEELTASDVAGKPVPGAESGRIDATRGESTLRKVGRGALFVPKLTVQVAFAPIRGGFWAYERYHLDALYRKIFFNDAETIGLYPIASLQSGYGLNVGVRFVHRDVFGEREQLRLRAGTGGQFRQIYSAKLTSGDRLGERVALKLAGEFERRPKDAFYGIGNGEFDRGSGELVQEARFRQQLMRVMAIGDVRVVSDLHVRGSGAIADFTFDPSEVGEPIDELFPMATMVGWDGVRHGYGELELRWDSRRRGSRWEVHSVRAAGWLLAASAGHVVALDEGADYWRFGADLQRFIRLGRGPRVLAARLYADGVTGSLDEVPFSQLPRLGGGTLLRGYPLDRFRDRGAAMGSLEYAWDLSRTISASTFVDAGRVFPSITDVELSGLRVGYGVALERHTASSFSLRASLASSIDGGVFFNLAFDPVFDLDPRVENQ